MTKIKQAKEILKALELPTSQQNEMSALTLLALCGIEKKDSWENATKKSLSVSKGIMTFVLAKYKKNYAPNTRETFRRQVLHQFVQARIADYNPDDQTLPTNSPRAHYALTESALEVIKKYGTEEWKEVVVSFLKKHASLNKQYQRIKVRNEIPVILEAGEKIILSPGKHNELQAAIVESFAPQFAPGSMLLYLGDTAQKNLYTNTNKLEELGISITQHSKLPDVILLDVKKDWIFLIEAVTSHGPMNPKRILELEKLFAKCKKGIVYVSAFLDFIEFKKHSKFIAWDSEVWVSEFPDHMIHFNGDRFMGPR